jgi:hypothetical protein
MVDQEAIGSQLKRIVSLSRVRATSRWRSATRIARRKPVMLHIDMKPGRILAHLHRGTAEALYVVEGDFTKEAGTKQALRCTSRLAGYTARTPLRTGASCSSFGQSALRMRRQISLTS